MDNFDEYFEFNKSQQENDDGKLTEQDIENIRNVQSNQTRYNNGYYFQEDQEDSFTFNFNSISNDLTQSNTNNANQVSQTINLSKNSVNTILRDCGLYDLQGGEMKPTEAQKDEESKESDKSKQLQEKDTNNQFSRIQKEEDIKNEQKNLTDNNFVNQQNSFLSDIEEEEKKIFGDIHSPNKIDADNNVKSEKNKDYNYSKQIKFKNKINNSKGKNNSHPNNGDANNC